MIGANSNNFADNISVGYFYTMGQVRSGLNSTIE